MGQRADLVIVRDGDWLHYYDHWCANTLDVDLFWGPELAVRFIEQRAPLDDRDRWLDEIWGEGGVIVDLDRSVMLWFGGEDILWEVPRRRLHLELLRQNWPGWDVRWAHEGLGDIVAYLGLSREIILTEHAPDPSECFKILDEASDNTALITVRKDTETRVIRAFGDAESMELGEAAFPQVFELAEQSLVWKGEPPRCGVHLDYPKRECLFWSADVVQDPARRIGGAWSGWTFRWLRDDFEKQLRASGLDIALPPVDAVAVRAAILAHAERNRVRAAKNPAVELGARLGATEINPWTEEARGTADLHGRGGPRRTDP